MSTTPTGGGGAHHVPLSTADKLSQDASEAARVRSLANHPDVVALRVERVRSQVDLLMWVGIVLGLGFTMVNVQHFAAEGSPAWSLPWLAAWLLDPMVSLVLIAVLRAEQITARYQVATGRWASGTKWFTFAATYVMNTSQSWAALDAAGVVLHSVPPVLVLCGAETAPWLRDRLTEAVRVAACDTWAGDRVEVGSEGCAAEPGEPGPPSRPGTTVGYSIPTRANVPVNMANTEPFAGSVGSAHDPSATEPAPSAANALGPVPGKAEPAAPRTASTPGAGQGRSARKGWGDYLAEARAAYVPGVEPTPAWVRSVTECGRATSKKVADALRAETATPATEPSTAEPVETARRAA